jgi:hypothetical protein
MTELTPGSKRSSLTPQRQRMLTLGMIIAGLICGGILIFALMRVFPQLEPGGQRFVFTEYDGDTFRHQPGMVRPPAENRILEDRIHFDDADGFRRPLWLSDEYPIIAIGDSFTDGGQVAWTDTLATLLDTPVRNLGWSGYGPLEYAEIMKQYGGGDHDWVLVMFFEGNDLSNIRTSYLQAQQHNGIVEIDLTRITAPPVENIRQLSEYSSDEIQLNPDDNYLYPLHHIRPDGSTFAMAYISDYLWWLNGNPETYRQSQNIALLETTLSTIKLSAGDACVALVYAPAKEHVYFQYAEPEGNRVYVLQNSLELLLDAEGWLSFTGLQAVDYDVLTGRIDNMRDVVQQTVENTGLQFIDLLPAFQQASQSGELAYYPYDSHWSQRGHSTTAQAIADYINAHPCA